MREMYEQELYLKHCKLFKQKLKEITDPVVPAYSNRSYQALSDVITNVILLEMNIDKMPWEQIPKREVVSFDSKVASADIIKTMSDTEIATTLLDRIRDAVSYQDRGSHDIESRTDLLADFALFSALVNFIRENSQKDYQ